MRLFSTILAICLLACVSVWGQVASVAQISGTVTDPSGLAVGGAEVKVTQTSTSLVRTTVTAADGSYVLPSLPVGPYRMEVSKQGFSTYVQTGIVLEVNQNPTIALQMKMGAVTEQVQVEAAAGMVETRSTGVGQVVDQQRVVDLPLNGRNATQLIFLAGAADAAPPADLISTKNYIGEVSLSIGGGLATGTEYLLDGGTHNDPFNNLSLPLPFPDALQEFKVETSALPAQYGQHSAGAVNAVTKSGSNQVHGDAFEFVRNYMFNARNFFATARDSLKRNQFGGTLGGPIKKDKLFFFLGYQGTLIRSNPSQSTSFIPTPQMLTGDFTTIASAACNGGRPVALRAPFVNNRISPASFSPAALKMMTYYPPTSDACGRENFALVQNEDEHTGIARVDYQMTTRESMFLRYYGTHVLVPTTYDGKNPLTMTLSGADDLVNSAVFGHTFVLSPEAVNSFRATFNRSGVTKTQVPTFDGPSLGIKMNTLVPGHVVISAAGAIYSSQLFSYAATDPTTTHQLSDDFSMVKGNHQLGFGGNWIRPVQNVYGPLFGDGFFNFNGAATGLSMGDFLTGQAFSFTQGGIQYDDERYHYIGLYAQDAWKVTPRLTVNAGLRWEPYIGGSMPLGYVSHFYPDLFAQGVHSAVYPNAPAGVLYAGDPPFDTNGRPSHIRWSNFAPRLGVVWDPKGDGKMTVRASWGIFNEMPHTLFAYGFSQEPPWGSTITRPNVSLDDPWNGYAGGNPFPLNLGKNFVFPTFSNYTTYPLDLRTTYLEQWNLSVQKQLGANWLVSASYLGNNTIHLWADAAINAAQYIPGASTTANTNQRRTLYLANPAQGQYFATIHQLAPDSTASYNAMLLSVRHRLSHHFDILGNYTWSHCITDPLTSELDGTQYTNPANRRFDRGNCPGIDRRHLANLSMVAEAPKFSARWAQLLAGDWKLAAIMSIESGSYLTVTTSADQALNGITNSAQRVSLVANSPLPAQQTYAQWINPAAFAQPALGTFGNLGASNILGPGWFQFDTALTRQFHIKERHAIEARWEAFNLFNHVRPPNPGTNLSTLNTFGQISSAVISAANPAGDPRIMQFALKYIF